MKTTSINIRPIKVNSETHNQRKKDYSYVRKDLSVQNESFIEEKISSRIKKIELFCKEKSGRKLQKNAEPIREGVIVIKEDTTLEDLKNLAARFEEEFKIRTFQIYIHRDEGHYDDVEWKPNLHAHMVFDWQDQMTGKTLKHKPHEYKLMQTITAEVLGMSRGVPGDKMHLDAIQFKIKSAKERYERIIQKQKESLKDLETQKENSDEIRNKYERKLNELLVNPLQKSKIHFLEIHKRAEEIIYNKVIDSFTETSKDDLLDDNKTTETLLYSRSANLDTFIRDAYFSLNPVENPWTLLNRCIRARDEEEEWFYRPDKLIENYVEPRLRFEFEVIEYFHQKRLEYIEGLKRNEQLREDFSTEKFVIRKKTDLVVENKGKKI